MATKQPRGWIVVERPDASRVYMVALDGAVFANRYIARQAAARRKLMAPEMTVRTVREGIVK